MSSTDVLIDSSLPKNSDSSEHMPWERPRESISKFQQELRKEYAKREKQKLKQPLPSSGYVLDTYPPGPTPILADPATFSGCLASSNRIVCLVGAGLSASSGINTFRGANSGQFWREYRVEELSEQRMFSHDPVTSWWYFAQRRNEALKAKPNAGHLALAEFARKKKGDMFVISQNIDGLLERANFPEDQVGHLHGCLAEVRCVDPSCDFANPRICKDPIIPALTVPEGVDLSDENVPLPFLLEADLPRCPGCQINLLRPNVTWFGENVQQEALRSIAEWLNAGDGHVDLMLVIGTTALVWPAAEYVYNARKKGAKIAVFNMEMPAEGMSLLRDGDWFFEGDSAVTLPEMLKISESPSVPKP